MSTGLKDDLKSFKSLSRGFPTETSQDTRIRQEQDEQSNDNKTKTAKYGQQDKTT